MQLTPEQWAQVDRAKAAGESPIIIDETPEQRAEMDRLTALEEAGIAENSRYLRRREEAAKVPGLSGDIRRAIIASRRAPQEIAVEIGADPELIDAFAIGDAELSGDIRDRLVAKLLQQYAATAR